MRRGRRVATAAALLALVLGTGIAAQAADEATCRQYADEAVRQLQRGRAHGCSGLVPPVWSENWRHHYDWCLRVPAGQADQGTAQRRQALVACGAEDSLPPSAAPGGGGVTATPPQAPGVHPMLEGTVLKVEPARVWPGPLQGELHLYTPAFVVGARVVSRPPGPANTPANLVAGPGRVYEPNRLVCSLTNVGAGPRSVRVVVQAVGTNRPEREFQEEWASLEPGRTAVLVYDQDTVADALRSAGSPGAFEKANGYMPSFQFQHHVQCEFVTSGSPEDFRAAATVYEAMGVHFRPLVSLPAR